MVSGILMQNQTGQYGTSRGTFDWTSQACAVCSCPPGSVPGAQKAMDKMLELPAHFGADIEWRYVAALGARVTSGAQRAGCCT